MPFWKKEKYSDAPTCTKCGAIYPTNARFCPQCGEEVKVPPAPTPSKPKKSEEAEEDWHKNMVRSLKKQGWSDKEIAASGQTVHEVGGGKPKKYKSRRSAAQKQKMLDAQGDVGLALSGPLGWFLLGRRQNKRKQDAQQQRIESLLRDIKNKK
jgi:predicted  nucleic acid-binding Zn-ribbon protein